MRKQSRKHLSPGNQVEPEKSISTLGFHACKLSSSSAEAKFPTFLTRIREMLINHEQTDTKVVVGPETFECHMLVLKSYSEFFEKLENNQNLDTRTVFLPEDKVSPTAFARIYEWMISEDNGLNRSCFAEVYKAAKYLEIHDLISQFMRYIDDKKVIEEREALSIYLEAKEVEEKSLQTFMIKKISKIFLTFVASWEYIELLYEEIEDFFKSNRLGVNSELDMLFAAIRWLQHEWPKRKKDVPRLLKLVRFELINSWQLVELKKYPKELEHIFKSPQVQDMIDNALSHCSRRHRNQSGDGELIPEVFKRRIINDGLWKKFDFEMNPNIFENYRNFCKYLNQLDSSHWQKLTYADPRHESVVL